MNEMLDAGEKIWATLTRTKLLWQSISSPLKQQGLWVSPSHQWWKFTNSGWRRVKP